MTSDLKNSFPEDTPTSFWWASDPQGVLYFLRELTGVGVAFYGLFFVAAWAIDPTLAFLETTWFKGVSLLGFISAVFHSITWLGVTMHVTPFDLSKWIERLGFFVLLLVWVFLSYFLFKFFYE